MSLVERALKEAVLYQKKMERISKSIFESGQYQCKSLESAKGLADALNAHFQADGPRTQLVYDSEKRKFKSVAFCYAEANHVHPRVIVVEDEPLEKIVDGAAIHRIERRSENSGFGRIRDHALEDEERPRFDKPKLFDEYAIVKDMRSHRDLVDDAPVSEAIGRRFLEKDGFPTYNGFTKVRGRLSEREREQEYLTFTVRHSNLVATERAIKTQFSFDESLDDDSRIRTAMLFTPGVVNSFRKCQEFADPENFISGFDFVRENSFSRGDRGTKLAFDPGTKRILVNVDDVDDKFLMRGGLAHDYSHGYLWGRHEGYLTEESRKAWKNPLRAKVLECQEEAFADNNAYRRLVDDKSYFGGLVYEREHLKENDLGGDLFDIAKKTGSLKGNAFIKESLDFARNSSSIILTDASKRDLVLCAIESRIHDPVRRDFIKELIGNFHETDAENFREKHQRTLSLIDGYRRRSDYG
jgi:hypothetical protein